MTLITDPDKLNQTTEIVIDTTTLTIRLVVAGNLSNDGVTGQALYSFLKEEWRTDNTLIPFDFPMVGITPEQFEFVEGWEPFDDTSRNLIRSSGWREIDNTKTVTREYMLIQHTMRFRAKYPKPTSLSLVLLTKGFKHMEILVMVTLTTAMKY
jgi:hypothetical protein